MKFKDYTDLYHLYTVVIGKMILFVNGNILVSVYANSASFGLSLKGLKISSVRNIMECVNVK